jgi:hypothetical protein
MTLDQRSNRMSPKRPPDRDGAARPATATRVPAYGQNSQTQPAKMVKRSERLGQSLQSTGPNAQMIHGQRERRHSTPIALAARGAA